jgi:4-hydroxy-tetrahydrodipicolinate reductase
MGLLLEQLRPAYGFAVKQKLNRQNNGSFEALTEEGFQGGWMRPCSFLRLPPRLKTFLRLVKLGVNVVTGTTGWLLEFDRVRQAAEDAGVGLVWSPNYSVGLHVFTPIIVRTAELPEGGTDYGAWTWEIHHAAKKEPPSATLKALEEKMRRSGCTR